MTDVVLIHPNGSHGIYGEIGGELIAREQPLWPRLIAGALLDKSVDVRIIDAECEELSPKRVADLVEGFNPRLCCIVVSGHQPSASTQAMPGARAIAEELTLSKFPGKVIMMGNHPSALPVQTLREERVDYVIDGEGPTTILGLLNDDPLDTIPGLVWNADAGEVRQNPAAGLLDINRDLHGRAWHLLPHPRSYRSHNWQRLGDGARRSPYAAVHTSLGCPYTCLAGDTPVNTVHGLIPIRDLVGRPSVPVFTYDIKTKAVKVATAKNIRRTGRDKKLVRVTFDDGTHIDCTPDHKFQAFKWGNGKSRRQDWTPQAADLAPGTHVRAFRFENPLGYPMAAWGRHKNRMVHRLVAEWKVGRKLKRNEHVHHLDADKENYSPENLQVGLSAKEHMALHPELSERMRTDNPTKNGMSKEWIERIRRGVTGLKRSAASIENYRRAALKREAQKRGEINHIVVSVEPLSGRHDVYCMEVPDTGWFFANQVLVKNCSFCMINVFQHTNRYRMRKPGDVVADFTMLYEQGVRTFKIVDELFLLNRRHVTAICEQLAATIGRDVSIWCYGRTDTVDPAYLKLLRSAGIDWIALGIESGSEAIRDGADKSLSQDEIADVVRQIEQAGINVIANYIFGLPGETRETMQQTLNLAWHLNTAFANFYSAMAYPGSKLYDEAKEKGWTLPETWAGYSQHNEHTLPLAPGNLPAREILAFRDEAFTRYFNSPRYLAQAEQRFGHQVTEQIKKMTSYKLKRKLLEATP